MFQRSNAVKQTYIADLWLTVTVMTNTKRRQIKRLTFYHRGITVGVARHPRGITVNVVPITAVSPRSLGIPAVPITVETSNTGLYL